jgi:putative RecB family exonuclease
MPSSDPPALLARLSPSRAKDFLQCPKLFYYKTVLKIPTPGTEATLRGTLAHYAFEHVFDHPRGERGVDVALSYVRPAWKVLTEPLAERDSVEEGSPEDVLRKDTGSYRDLHAEGSKGEAALLATAADAREVVPEDATEDLLTSTEAVVRSWYAMENPDKFDPLEREFHLQAKVGDATLHGFIDRLDRIEAKDGTVRYYISDYKTGKVPSARFAEEAFFQLDVYATLVKAMLGVTVHQLRLIYVKAGRPDAVLTRPVDARRLERTEAKVSALWRAINTAAAKDDFKPRKQVLCDWCFFKSVCPAHHPELEGLTPEEVKERLGVK